MPVSDKPGTNKRQNTESLPEFNPFNNVLPKAMSSVARMHSDVFDAYMTCNIEMLDFLKSRYEEDRKLVANVATSGEPPEMFDACMDFWCKAMADYTGEAGKLARLNTGFAAETVKHISDDANVISKNFASATAA